MNKNACNSLIFATIAMATAIFSFYHIFAFFSKWKLQFLHPVYQKRFTRNIDFNENWHQAYINTTGKYILFLPSVSTVTNTCFVLYVLKCLFSLYENYLFSKQFFKNFLNRFFFIFILLTKWHLYLNILKNLGWVFFLFGNKFYLKLTTGQENSKNSEQGKQNIDWRILSLQWFWMSNQWYWFR